MVKGSPRSAAELGDHAFHLVVFRGPVAGHLLHNGHAGAHVGRNFVQGVQQAWDFLIQLVIVIHVRVWPVIMVIFSSSSDSRRESAVRIWVMVFSSPCLTVMVRVWGRPASR